MKQEELKVALCGYLPYEPCFLLADEESKEYEFGYVTNINFATQEVTISNTDYYFDELNNMVLHNISTLTKPIIVKGYNGGLSFVPIEEINNELETTGFEFDYCDIRGVIFSNSINNCFALSSEIENIYNLLNRWKIDYRNLIGQGLAIDVETLKENCYE